jgi:hypothetical protein
VDVQVLEQSFVEVPTVDITGMDRRAFGEFVGRDPTLIDVLDLAPGHSASRSGVGAPWIRRHGYLT